MIDTLIMLLTLIATITIPRRIMVNQIYADLLSQYRGHDMGDAIMSIVDFYVHDCHSQVDLIKEKYKKRYKKEIKKKALPSSETLHFKRRLVEQFYWQLATLRYEYGILGLSKRRMKKDFTDRDCRLLSLVHYMGLAAGACFEDIGDIQEPEESDGKMEQMIYRLYEESESWE